MTEYDLIFTPPILVSKGNYLKKEHLNMATYTHPCNEIERRFKFGGLYSSVAECLAAKCPTPIGYVAVEDEFGEVGPQDYLEERFGLTAEHIASVVEETIARK